MNIKYPYDGFVVKKIYESDGFYFIDRDGNLNCWPSFMDYEEAKDISNVCGGIIELWITPKEIREIQELI